MDELWMAGVHHSQIAGGLHGFEKEGIRITPNGHMSPRPHPAGLGSSLTHPYITTDFTEPQLEFRTSPRKDISEALDDLREVHIYAVGSMGEELIWPFSMPPKLPESEEDIPLAVYGNSPEGIKKTLYRRGIGYRYGRKRLTISGVHYNFSLDPQWFMNHMPDAPAHDRPASLSDGYLHIIRNLFRRICFLTYLSGASPAFDKSFDPTDPTPFTRHKSETFYGAYATSLRSGDIGYTSRVQKTLPISYDTFATYIKGLDWATETCNPDYLKFSGHPWNQLNPNYLQAAYELYAPFRLKPPAAGGAEQMDAMKQHGAGYVELRLPDLDPAYPDGINPDTMFFLHLVILECLMSASPPLGWREKKEIDAAHREIIMNGRKKGISIQIEGKSRPFHDQGKTYCESLYPLAEIMDHDAGRHVYCRALSRQIGKWEDPGKTPSGRHLSDLLDNSREFTESGLDAAMENSRHFKRCAPDPQVQNKLRKQALHSIALQRQLESGRIILTDKKSLT